MHMIEGRFTHSKTEGFEWYAFKSWLDSLDCNEILVCQEDKEFLTNTPVQPHMHAFFNSNIKQNSLRDSYKKKFNAKGNTDFKFSKVRDLDKYLRYICKCNNIVYSKGFTKEQTDQYHNEFLQEAKKIKEAKKNKTKTKLKKIKEYIQGKGYLDLGMLTSKDILKYTIQYHIENELMFSEFDLKRIVTTILVNYHTPKERERYINNLIYDWNL